MDLHAAARQYRWRLWLLVTIFAVRVAAQPLALVVDAAYLPRFDAWHSGVIPYWVLAASQIVILGALVRLTRGVSPSRAPFRRSTGLSILVAGAVYFAVMVARLVLGRTVLSGHPWFARPLPTVFHLVLAGFLLVCGHYHYRYGASR